MKTYQTNQIRNITLCGNAGSGKTTLAEAMLFNGGVIDRRGTVEQKNTASDYFAIEHEINGSVYSSVLYTEYNDKKINIIDNPGLDDFISGLVSSLKVADLGVIVINAQNGVEVGTEIHARWLDKAKKPMMFLINTIDHDKANYEKTVESIKERFGKNVIPIQFPVNEGIGFNAVVDVILMKKLTYNDDSGKAEISDIPTDLMDRALEMQNQLIEKAAENDEKLMEIFFANDTLTEDEMRAGIRAGLLERGIFPLFCVSAKKNIAVSRFMEFISNVAPSPDHTKPAITDEGEVIKCDASGSPSLFIFKTTIEPHIGEINYFKVMSGEVVEGADLVNNNTGSKERLSQIFAVAGKNRNKIQKIVAGDIGATVKLKNTKSNQTLTASAKSYKFAPIEFPEPKYRTAVKTVTEGDEEKLNDALHRLHEEDPTIQYEYSKELKQLIVSGQGEHHLNTMKWYIENIFKVEIQFIAPKIPYRETITKLAQADYRHKKQSGGSGQFGEVHMIVEPYHEGMPDPTTFKINGKELKVSVRDKDENILPWGGKLVFLNCIVGGAIDARFLPAILKGVMEKMEEGPLTGSYARDIRIAVYDGKMHPVDSNEISFRLAGRNAFRAAFKEAGPKILEPIYLVEILVPGDRMGDVMSDLQGRRGVVQGMISEKGFEKITAKVPLSEMNKYSTSLSSLTGGRAMYSMKFAEYAPVSPEIQENLLKAYEAEQEEE